MLDKVLDTPMDMSNIFSLLNKNVSISYISITYTWHLHDILQKTRVWNWVFYIYLWDCNQPELPLSIIRSQNVTDTIHVRITNYHGVFKCVSNRSGCYKSYLWHAMFSDLIFFETALFFNCNFNKHLLSPLWEHIPKVALMRSRLLFFS